MSSSRPEQLQNLINLGRRREWGEDELSDEDITRLYSRLFNRCKERRESDSHRVNCYDNAFRIGNKRLYKNQPFSRQDEDIERRKRKLGGQLKSGFNIDNLTEIDRWVVSCENGYLTILPGDTVLSRLYCPLCHNRLWIDPHPEERPRDEIHQRTVERLSRSQTFLE